MKKHLFLLLTVFLLPLTVCAFTGSIVIDGINYYIVTKGQTAEVIANNYSGDITIPSTVEYEGVTCNVTSIGEQAFYKCYDLTSITIPNSVTSIGKYAFTDCRKLTSVVIPSSVEKIGFDAFWCCSNLASVTISNGVKYIDNNAFDGCHKLTSITIPKSVSFIGQYVFGSCSSLVSINVDEGNEVYDSRDNCNAIIETATNTLVASCINTTIPQSVTSIGCAAFSNCEGLTNINIPNSVTTINDDAFSYCDELTSIIIPNSVTTIRKSAFKGCNKVKYLIIGNGIKLIEENAFAYCTELTDVYCYAENVPNTFSGAFNNSYIEYSTLHVPSVSIEKYKDAYTWNEFKEIVGLTSSDPKPTGIKAIEVENFKKEVYYDLNGHLMQNPQQGIYILNGKKILIK